MNSRSDNDEATGTDRSVTDRRTILTAAAAGVVGGLAAAATATHAQEQPASPLPLAAASFGQSHEPKTLPFETSSLDGISAAVIESHWSNNYGGSVRALNETKRRLAEALADDDLPPYVYNGPGAGPTACRIARVLRRWTEDSIHVRWPVRRTKPRPADRLEGK